MVRCRFLIVFLACIYLSAVFIRPIGEGLHFIEHLISESTFYFHHHHSHDHHDHHHDFSEVFANVFNQPHPEPVPPSENDLKLNPHNLQFSTILGVNCYLTKNQINTPYSDISTQFSGVPDTPPPKVLL
ncbi:hypothetical protein ACFLU5_17050 [Bacteroidota bacterium]